VDLGALAMMEEVWFKWDPCGFEVVDTTDRATLNQMIRATDN